MPQFRNALANLLLIAFTTTSTISALSAKEGIIPVGVNVNNFQNFDAAKQQAIVKQLKDSKVQFVRTSLRPDEKNLNLAKTLQDNGIGLVLVPGFKYGPQAHERPANPESHMRAAMPLSECDVELSKANFQDIFDKFDSKGVVLTAVELGNEINWTDFNGDFPVPGEGKVFSREDLDTNPEAKKVAKGYLQYIKLLKALKSVRDHSRLNSKTPIIAAGMAGATDGAWRLKSKLDAVSVGATYAFMREYGLDDLVEGYGTHAYPGIVKAGDKKAFAEREQKMDKSFFPEGNGKPYWVTEWGFINDGTESHNEDVRLRSVIELRTYFHKIQKQGRLGGTFWYVWNEPDKCSIYRDGQLVEAGMRATRPMN